MPLIKCPTCEKEISSEAEACIHCGQPMKKTLVKCPTCEREISSEAEVCNYCGQPMKKDNRTQNNVPSQQNLRNGVATASFVLGLIGMIAWIIPIIGAPVTILGLIFGIRGCKSRRARLAVTGIILCIIGLLGTTVNASIGAYKGSNGILFLQHDSAEVEGIVVFCDSVDTENDLHPINPSANRKVGEYFTVVLFYEKGFQTSEINLTIYKEDDESEDSSETIISRSDEQVNRDWTTFSMSNQCLNTAGLYKFEFTRISDNKKLANGYVRVN